MNGSYLIRQIASLAFILPLSFTAPAFAQQKPPTETKQGTSKSIWKKDLLDFKSITLQWDGPTPIRVITIPFINGKSLAGNFLLGKIPFVGTGNTKSSFLQIRKAISAEEVTRMSSPDWDAEQEIALHLKKNPFENEEALLLLEPGEEIRFEMDATKSIGIKLGAGPLMAPVGGAATIGHGQDFIFVIRKLNDNQVQLDVTQINQTTKSTKANIGAGFTFLADSQAAVGKKLNFRDFYSSIYMNLIQNVQTKGATDSYILDLNSSEQALIFNEGIIKSVSKNPQSAVKSGDDVQVLEESFMDDLETESSQINPETLKYRSEMTSDTYNLNRNAGAGSLFGKFLYSFKFSRNFIKIESPNNAKLGILQFYQSEASIVAAKRSIWNDKNGRLSNMEITFSTKGDYENPEIDKLLEIAIHTTRYSYARNNQNQLQLWREFFADFLPKPMFKDVFSESWSAERGDSLVSDPRLNASVYFNRDYLLNIANQALNTQEGSEFFFTQKLKAHIQNTNNLTSTPSAPLPTVLQTAYQFVMDKLGQDKKEFIDIENSKTKKQIQDISKIFSEAVNPNTEPQKRLEAFESLRKIPLFKKISIGFLLSLVEKQDLNKFVTIEVARSHNESVEELGAISKKHQYKTYRTGAQRDPEIKFLKYLINRTKATPDVIPEFTEEQNHLGPIKCESVFFAS
ncbi:MAG: hypothetical protein ACXVCY_11440 [Pseudobdellovibrionaceae bacterium]